MRIGHRLTEISPQVRLASLFGKFVLCTISTATATPHAPEFPPRPRVPFHAPPYQRTGDSIAVASFMRRAQNARADSYSRNSPRDC